MLLVLRGGGGMGIRGSCCTVLCWVVLMWGFWEIEIAVIRNAGGRAADAVRSLVVLDALIPIGAVMVVHHTGMSPLKCPLPPFFLRLLRYGT